MIDEIFRLVIFVLYVKPRKFMYFDELNEFVSIFLEFSYILYLFDLQHLIYLFLNIQRNWMKVNNMTGYNPLSMFP